MIIVQPYNVIKLTERDKERARQRQNEIQTEKEKEGVCVADSDDFSVWHAQSTIDF